MPFRLWIFENDAEKICFENITTEPLSLQIVGFMLSPGGESIAPCRLRGVGRN